MALESLLDGVDDVLWSQRESFNRAVPVDTELFKSTLTQLRSAVENMNGGTINGAIDALLQMALPHDVNNTVQNILKNIMLVEFDEAIAQIDALLTR